MAIPDLDSVKSGIVTPLDREITFKEMATTWGDRWQGAKDGGSAAPGCLHHAGGTQLRDGRGAEDAPSVRSGCSR